MCLNKKTLQQVSTVRFYADMLDTALKQQHIDF